MDFTQPYREHSPASGYLSLHSWQLRVCKCGCLRDSPGFRKSIFYDFSRNFFSVFCVFAPPPTKNTEKFKKALMQVDFYMSHLSRLRNANTDAVQLCCSVWPRSETEQAFSGEKTGSLFRFCCNAVVTLVQHHHIVMVAVLSYCRIIKSPYDCITVLPLSY